jgi:hypothetical protein
MRAQWAERGAERQNIFSTFNFLLNFITYSDMFIAILYSGNRTSLFYKEFPGCPTSDI